MKNCCPCSTCISHDPLLSEPEETFEYLALPPELMVLVASFLDGPSRARLSFTCARLGAFFAEDVDVQAWRWIFQTTMRSYPGVEPGGKTFHPRIWSVPELRRALPTTTYGLVYNTWYDTFRDTVSAFRNHFLCTVLPSQNRERVFLEVFLAWKAHVQHVFASEMIRLNRHPDDVWPMVYDVWMAVAIHDTHDMPTVLAFAKEYRRCGVSDPDAPRRKFTDVYNTALTRGTGAEFDALRALVPFVLSYDAKVVYQPERSAMFLHLVKNVYRSMQDIDFHRFAKAFSSYGASELLDAIRSRFGELKWNDRREIVAGTISRCMLRQPGHDEALRWTLEHTPADERVRFLSTNDDDRMMMYEHNVANYSPCTSCYRLVLETCMPAAGSGAEQSVKRSLYQKSHATGCVNMLIALRDRYPDEWTNERILRDAMLYGRPRVVDRFAEEATWSLRDVAMLALERGSLKLASTYIAKSGLTWDDEHVAEPFFAMMNPRLPNSIDNEHLAELFPFIQMNIDQRESLLRAMIRRPAFESWVCRALQWNRKKHDYAGIDCNTLFRPIASHGTLAELREACVGYVLRLDLYMELRELASKRADEDGRALHEYLDNRCETMLKQRERTRRMRRELREGKRPPMTTRKRTAEQKAEAACKKIRKSK